MLRDLDPFNPIPQPDPVPFQADQERVMEFMLGAVAREFSSIKTAEPEELIRKQSDKAGRVKIFADAMSDAIQKGMRAVRDDLEICAKQSGQLVREFDKQAANDEAA